MKTANQIREYLYVDGVSRCLQFLTINDLPVPMFFRYSEIEKVIDNRAKRFLEMVQNGPLQGTGTGLYRYNHIFVNVPVTALPVNKPRARSWSYPCWKTDRTAVGVLAHELGHHIECVLQERGKLIPHIHGAAWRDLITKCKKKVSGYEPVPSEAWAESMRLFILNPELLCLGIPERFKFIQDVGLKCSEHRHWYEVLGNHPNYVEAGKKWIS